MLRPDRASSPLRLSTKNVQLDVSGSGASSANTDARSAMGGSTQGLVRNDLPMRRRAAAPGLRAVTTRPRVDDGGWARSEP